MEKNPITLLKQELKAIMAIESAILEARPQDLEILDNSSQGVYSHTLACALLEGTVLSSVPSPGGTDMIEEAAKDAWKTAGQEGIRQLAEHLYETARNGVQISRDVANAPALTADY